MSKGANKTNDPLDEVALIDALQRSGYPFEVELLAALDGYGLDPVNGFRLRVAKGDARPSKGDDPEGVSAVTREIDVMANVHVAKPVRVNRASDGVEVSGPISARLVAMIEAKSLPPSSAFVGFTFKQPDAHHRRSLRCRFAGAPSHGTLPAYSAGQLAMNLAAALDPINDAPHCVQWALVERPNGGNARADHPGKWAAALSNLARALHLHARAITEFLLGAAATNGARIDYFEPTLFVKTPTLWLYDVATKALTKTSRLTLAQYFEVASGNQEHRLVDVVANTDVQGFADRYKQVKANLEGAIESNGADLLALAEAQRNRWRTAKARRVRSARRRRRPLP